MRLYLVWQTKITADQRSASLTNKEDKKPLKIKVDPNEQAFAILCWASCGPIFSGGIYIADNANTTMDSYCQLGACFKHPQYAHGTNEALTFLAGSYEFQLDEIEVYGKAENKIKISFCF